VHKFTDAKGREWRIELTYGVLQQVKEDLGIDLLDVQSGGAKSQGLGFDLTAFINLLFVVCEDQAKEANLSDVDFGRSLGGSALKEAFDAFQAEYVDFFQFSPATQQILTTSLGTAKEATEALTAMALEEISSPETKAAMQEKLESSRDSMRGSIAAALRASPA
jgi:hypothetical protein